MGPRSAGALLSIPAAAQRCAEGAGLDSGVLAAAQSAIPSIAAAAAMTADMISTGLPPLLGPSATTRIYTPLTDVTVVRARLDRKATAIVLLVVLGVREDGQKVLLAAKNMGGETSAAWRAVLHNLIQRGLRKPEFLIVDGGTGLEQALATLWGDVPTQRARCISTATVFRDRYSKASAISLPPCLPRLLPAGANRRVGLAPTGKRRLVTAHMDGRRWASSPTRRLTSLPDPISSFNRRLRYREISTQIATAPFRA